LRALTYAQRTLLLLLLLLMLVVMLLPWQRSGATSYRHDLITGSSESWSSAGKWNCVATCRSVANTCCCYRFTAHHVTVIFTLSLKVINSLMGTLKPQSNGPLYSSTVIGTLVVDGWAVTFGTARRDLQGALRLRPVPSLLYQMQQPTHQRPVYQLHITRRGAVTFAL